MAASFPFPRNAVDPAPGPAGDDDARAPSAPVAAGPARRMAAQPAVACISSGSLLAGGNEVLIDHHGALYRLKQTSLGKLILTK